MTQTSTPSGERRTTQRVYSAELLGHSRELVILHRGEEYRLRITGNDKLLLTK
ncbi:hemin uptake protein HemP [Sulfurivermis fontis]|uniref:hemin uptake protein HemP n=1 Tax=Sulfurivermis fontis TaxID=1972068 RepID=UPI000FDB3126|nr:hemin uptake protein HemP [Sulfurivermis fontis]